MAACCWGVGVPLGVSVGGGVCGDDCKAWVRAPDDKLTHVGVVEGAGSFNDDVEGDEMADVGTDEARDGGAGVLDKTGVAAGEPCET